MKNVYKTICSKLAKSCSSFKIKWIPRESNAIAHNHSYSAFRKLKAFHERNDLLVIDQKTFFNILMKFDKAHIRIMMFLYNTSNEQKIIHMTQKQMATSLNMSLPSLNKCIKNFIAFNILQKVQNGKYAILM